MSKQSAMAEARRRHARTPPARTRGIKKPFVRKEGAVPIRRVNKKNSVRICVPTVKSMTLHDRCCSERRENLKYVRTMDRKRSNKLDRWFHALGVT